MRTGIQPEIKAPQRGAVQQKKKAKKAVAPVLEQQQKNVIGVPPSLDEALFVAPEKIATTGLKDTDFNAQQVGQLAADPSAGIPDILDAQFVDVVNIPTAKAAGPTVVETPTINEGPATKNTGVAPVVTEGKKEAKAPETGKEAEVPVTIAKTPEENPNFQALKMEVGDTAKAQQHHESSSKASSKAQAAAPSPSNERESLAQAKQVNVMNEQDAEEFSAADFKVQLQSRIAEMQLPKDEDEADNFEENNNISEVNKNALGDVSGASKKSSGKIATATAAAPNTAAEPKRAVAKMPTPKLGKKPSIGGAGKAMPPTRTAAEVEQPLQQQNSAVDNEMEAHGVTDTMLANSNEASFTGALAEKNAAKAQSDAATQQFRTQEEEGQQQVQQNAQQQTNTEIGGMNASRVAGLNKVANDQKKTASKDSVERKRIADAINGKYEATKTKVDGILDQLDTDVAAAFVTGSNAAKKAFESHIEKEMTAYKKERYGDSWYSWKNIRRAGDYFVGLPEEVNEFFVTGREVYINTMDGYIETIANMVANKLNQAKLEIAKGKQEVQDYVSSLSPSLRKLGKEAATAIEDKFDSLEQTVNDKKDTLIEALAEQYAANIEAVDARIEELKAANEGLVSKALGALKGVFDFIIKVKNTLTNLLAKIVEVVVAIIADPIGFLSNMMAGVGQGISNFSSNIVKHLQSGLISWLTGAMSGLSITMPDDVFSLKGIFSLSSQIMGFTWQAIRRVGTRVIGEPVMKALETGFELVNILRTEGLAGLWEYIKEQFQDLKATVIDAVMDLIQTQVVQAGIKWLLGLLSPVGAFVKAVMAIIDVVKFFIERAAQIADLVNAFMDSVSAIAAGKVGAVAAAIENALGKAVPVVIGLLASILGIGGLARKVIKLFKKIQKRVEKALVKLWKKIKKMAKRFLSKTKKALGIKDKNNKKSNKSREELEDSVVGDTIDFTADGEEHQLWISDTNGIEVMVASERMSVKQRILKWRNEVDSLPENEKENAKSLLAKAESQYKTVYGDAIDTSNAFDKAEKENATDNDIQKAETLDKNLEEEQKQLALTQQQLFSIFGESNELNYSVQQLVFVNNENVNLEEGKYPHSFAKQLSSIENTVLRLENNKEIREEVINIREKWKLHKGAIYSPFITEQQQALQRMQENIKGEFIITFERGGSLIGDQLIDGTDISNEKIPKRSRKYKSEQPQELIELVHNYMKGRENEAVTVDVVESLFSGSSGNTILKAFAILEKQYSNLSYKLHMLQETMGLEHESNAEDLRLQVSKKMADANKVEVYIQKTKFVLGEDISAQSEYGNEEPIVVFKGSDTKLAAYKIIPKDGTSTRMIIVALAGGEFNGKLNGVL